LEKLACKPPGKQAEINNPRGRVFKTGYARKNFGLRRRAVRDAALEADGSSGKPHKSAVADAHCQRSPCARISFGFAAAK